MSTDADDRMLEPQPAGTALRVRIDLAYVGTEFHGWQIQPDRRSVQGELHNMLSRLLGRDCQPCGAGRTDAGVHARGQVCHVDIADRREFERLERALAGMAPPDLAVTRVRLVSRDFSSRFSAVSRRYSYHLLLKRDIFRSHVFHVPYAVDREAMDRAAAYFPGTHDFSSFCKTRSLKDDGNVCQVDLCRFQWAQDSAIFQVRANRFLHHMVRNLVGTLLEVGRGTRRPDEMPNILAARDRGSAGKTVPAQGLFLEEVTYPEQLLDPAYRRRDGSDHEGPGDEANNPEGD